MDDGSFKDLNWSQITSLAIRYDSDDSMVVGFEFYNSLFDKLILQIGIDGDAYFKVNLRKGDRVVGIQAHKAYNAYYNLRLVIMGP